MSSVHAVEDDPVRIAAAILFLEARFLDEGRWTEWVGPYREDAVYWIPACRDEYETTSDPRTEVSRIYHGSRLGLEERIARIESPKSVTALPLPRVLHVIISIEAALDGRDPVRVRSAFAVHAYDPRLGKEHTRYGRYEHGLVRDSADGTWRISRKVINLVNDRVPTVVGFFSV